MLRMARWTAGALFATAVMVNAQAPQGPVVVSPEVSAERTITFRLLAPKADTVEVQGGDIQGLTRGVIPMVKGANGVWEATSPVVPAGAYRYRFIVNGVNATDPRNPQVSESNANSWSLVVVPGAAWVDVGQVPHGAVASVTYFSKSLNRNRRMHVYTPPGYELGKGKFPLFYLLHGASDCDDSWTSVGRAGFILDNLIAAGTAKPMIVVMPAGHTSTSMGPRTATARDEFADDFMSDIVPYVESHYRVLKGRQNRAIAGLSMGGGQTLNIGMAHLDQFAYMGVFSSGVFGRGPRTAGATPTTPPEWETERAAMLDNAKLKPGLKLLWFATGKDDFLLGTTKVTIEMLKKHGFEPVFKETDGGHTWLNWRDYLNEFAPKLFR
ncbi:alpha/beta hydrolase-fold protein [uncultured Paludibaculum sp.]|uniref:alpha/beta hydrolase-fold protein n=1 Tax=uncultured Paludibaculum sp. TaxID=1765020 RepID=UPI002AABF6F1|nr:alpha/beta hydrolase-fold protein [uncultured Paludibaculum sp.]